MNVTWAITPQKVQSVIKKIVKVCKPRKIILFGSYMLGNAGINSDLDVMVVTGYDVENPRKESVRVRRALKGISMPIDILVVSESRLEEMADTPGLIYREVVRKGEVVYESTN